MEDLIKALKENEKPFGLMMKALSTDPEYGDLMDVFATVGKNFQLYGNFTPGQWSNDLHTVTRDYTNHGETYRLRPDYEEKPSVVECGIWRDLDYLVYSRNDSAPTLPIGRAVSDPDFFGFKYDGTETAYSRPVMYNENGILRECASISDIKSDKVTPVRPIAVLFKGGK